MLPSLGMGCGLTPGGQYRSNFARHKKHRVDVHATGPLTPPNAPTTTTTKSDCIDMADSKAALWAQGRDEEVQVNQRALIDKVLARYSGEFTVFRELLQNSDDAGSTTAEIHFNTQAYINRLEAERGIRHSGEDSSYYTPPDLKKCPLVHWTFRNDGVPFRDEDWDRLKKIARGNPDEKKIGAFGVGFYSLFSVTDNPFVKSDTQWMGFYWKNKGDQLFVKRGDLKSTPDYAPSGTPWTSFEMPLRRPSPLPGLPINIARFLATSLTFMVNLRDVSMFIDGNQLVRIQKDTGSTKPLTIPDGLTPKRTGGIMEVKTMHSQDILISAQIAHWVCHNDLQGTALIEQAEPWWMCFSCPLFTQSSPTRTPSPDGERQPLLQADPLEVLRSNVYLCVYSAQVDVQVNDKMSTELERATKKRPPPTCTYSLIYTKHDEFERIPRENDIFQGLRADLDARGSARVFIGHATSQSTGIGGHVSARFIPTVERESIDLVNQHVSQWNKELLYVGGFLARFVYDMQMLTIQELWEQAMKPADTSKVMNHSVPASIEDKSVHVMRYFSFYPTAPSSLVGTEMEGGFFSSAQDNAVLVLSTTGVHSARQVRLYDPRVRMFLKELSMLPVNVAERAPAMVKVLRNRGMLQHVSIGDVLGQLSGCVLSEEEMVECLEWWITLDGWKLPASDKRLLLGDFLKAASFRVSPPMDGHSCGEKVVSLASVKSFLSPKNIIPQTSPLPPQTLPMSITKRFKTNVLQSSFGWNDLGVVEWVAHLVSPPTLGSLPADEDPTRSEIFAEKVLNIVARAWSTLRDNQRNRLTAMLEDTAIIPTRNGLKAPKQSYFSQGNLFQELSIVRMPNGSPIAIELEALLRSLGVMRHVEMHIVIKGMIDTGKWDMRELMRYLADHRALLPPLEFASLRRKAAFPRESIPGAQSYKMVPSDLYEPSDNFRQFGLPVLDWGTHEWNPRSDEARILYELGLKTHPELPTIMNLMIDPKEDIRKASREYFLDNFDALYAPNYKKDDVRHLAFIPAVGSDGTRFMAKPNDVYVDPRCAVMGFSVVDLQFHDAAEHKLGVPKQPPIELIMKALLNAPPDTPDTAQRYFEYLADRVTDFSPPDFNVLRDACIIPAPSPRDDSTPQEDTWVMVKPGECIFKTDAKTTPSNIHSKLFVSVDFGSKGNVFLKQCGVKDQPDIEDIVPLILQDPKKFLHMVGGAKGYLEQLRQLAAYRTFPPTLISRMRASSFLFGQRRAMREPKTDIRDANEDYDLTFNLLNPEEVAIVDDASSYLLFADCLYVAPEEDALETFYSSLGSPRLTSLINDDCHAYDIESSESEMTSKARNLILERLPLLLHEPNILSHVGSAWLSMKDHFAVRGCASLRLDRVLLFHGIYASKSQDVSANAIMARWCGKEHLVLLLKKGVEPDMYEMANSVCKAILVNSRPKDSLLFMTMLSTDLEALRRRGFNVDRILNRQKVRIAEGLQLAESTPSEKRVIQYMRQKAVPTTGGDSYCVVKENNDYREANQTYFGYQVFTSHDIPNPDGLLSSKRQIIERFVSIILNPLRTVFNLVPATLNMIYDSSTVLVSFNRCGGLFLNIKPYEEWHDIEVSQGKTEKALISWYHTIAHQIAHNLARSHNAKHGFYVSIICERHLPELGKLLRLKEPGSSHKRL